MNILKIHQKTVLAFILLFLFLLPCNSLAAQQTPVPENSAANHEIIPGMLLAAASNTEDTLPPSVPENLAVAHRTCTSISLSWTKSKDNVSVKGYQIFRDGKKTGSSSVPNYTNMYLVPGKQYIYIVKAFDTNGNISASSAPLTVSALPDTQPPTAPQSPAVSNITFTSALLEWKPSSDNIEVKGYEVFKDGVKKAVTGGTIYTCRGLSSGRSYTFAIRSFDTAGNYSPFTTLSLEVKADTSAPTTPNGLRAESVTETEATLVWTPSNDNIRIKGYEIFCAGKKVGTSVKATWQCKKLVPGKTVTYTVRAVDTSGLVSTQSSPCTFTALADRVLPTTPGDLHVSSSGTTTAKFTWDASTDNIKVLGYKIYCNGSVITETTKTSKSVKIPSGLNIDTYWVRAYDSSENLSAKSNSITVASYK